MPNNLQGLNIVYPDPPPSTYPNDPSLELLQVPADLSAQLDLWTNLSFQTDEPFLPSGDSADKSYDALDDDDDGSRPAGPAEVDAHRNVVTGTPVQNPAEQLKNAPTPANFNLQTFLSTLGLPPVMNALGEQTATHPTAPSLAQLLSLYSQTSGLAPAPAPAPAPVSASASTSSAPPAKRARTRKASVSVSVAAPSPEADDDDAGAPLGASEDKRRRNTAASARFRAKKKEREQALEKKARDMEARVGELERECEALRRENGWLKGLVVGVTGASQAPALPMSGAEISGAPKRTWEEVEAQ